MSDVVIDQERVRFLCNGAFRFGSDYARMNEGRPAPLRLYSARFGRAFAKAGMSLLEGLESDPRFEVKMSMGGGAYTVRVRSSKALEDRLAGLIDAHGPVDFEGLTEHLKGSGLKPSDVLDALMVLSKSGSVQMVDGMYSIPE